MKIIMFSTDQNIFREGSAVRQRMVEYGNLFEELHIIVYTRKSHAYRQAGETNLKSQISANVWIYPTNTYSKPLYFLDAYKLASSIIGNWKSVIRNFVITTQDPFETGLVGYLIKRKFKIPLQIQIHTDFLSPFFAMESMKNKLRALIGKWLIKRADSIRVVSERIKNSLATRAPIDVLPIYTDFNVQENRPRENFLRKKYPEFDFFILMVSRLTKEKNVGLAVEILPEIIKSNPKTALIVVGSGPEQDRLSKKANWLGIGNHIIFDGWQDDLDPYYQSADLFLSTSNYEGYGMAVVGAASVGVPVLMSDTGIAIGDVFPVGNKKILVEKLSELIKNSERRMEIVKEQTEYVKTLPTKEEYLKRFQDAILNCGK